MCLTIPKKVVEIRDDSVVVLTHTGDRQELKTLIRSLRVGDFVISQQNIIMEKMRKKDAEEMIELISKF